MRRLWELEEECDDLSIGCNDGRGAPFEVVFADAVIRSGRRLLRQHVSHMLQYMELGSGLCKTRVWSEVGEHPKITGHGAG
jgi:hypothetical protein